MPRSRVAIVALAAALLLSACVVAPYHPRRGVYSEPVPVGGGYRGGYGGGYGGYESDVIVDIAPPAPYVEIVPAIPFAGALWLGGHWGWRGNRHAWSPGRWEQPRPGYHWRPHAWVQQGNRWHGHNGGWARRR